MLPLLCKCSSTGPLGSTFHAFTQSILKTALRGAYYFHLSVWETEARRAPLVRGRKGIPSGPKMSGCQVVLAPGTSMQQRNKQDILIQCNTFGELHRVPGTIVSESQEPPGVVSLHFANSGRRWGH